MPLPRESAPSHDDLDEVAHLVASLGSRLTDLEDLDEEALVGSRQELHVAEQLLDRAVAQSERRRSLLESLSD
jgi:hypothetical protein